MLRNYFTVAFRHFRSNKFTIMTSVLGLAIGIACSIIAYLNWEFHNSYDSQHSNASRIFKIHTVRNIESDSVEFGVSPAMIGDAAGESINGVNSVTRYMKSHVIAKLDDKVIRQEMASVDPAFMEMFDFPLVYGSNGALAEEDKMYITEEMSVQFYGKENPVGRMLEIRESNGVKRLVEIAGVIEDHPLNSSFTFDIIMNYESYVRGYDWQPNDWQSMAHATFVELQPGTDPFTTESSLNTFIPAFNAANEDWQAMYFNMVPLPELADRARGIRENYLGSSNPSGTVMVPVIMALIILLVACINYMNAMVLMSGKRLKEMGIRKAIGGLRNQLISQLILENLLLLVTSMVLGIMLAELLLPVYNELGPWVELSTSYVSNGNILLFLVVLLLIVGSISCGYPSLYISRFNTMQIFRSDVKVGGAGRLSRVLMILQLGFSLIAMIQGITYVQNAAFQRDYDLGYRTSDIMSVRLQNGVDFEEFRNKILQIHGFEMAGTAEHHMGYGNLESLVEFEDRSAQVRHFNVGDTYLPTLGVDVIEGRGFIEDSELDFEDMVLINENLVAALGLRDPVDSRILINDTAFYVAGVVANFYPYGLWRDESEQLALFRLTEHSRFMAIRTSLDKKEADRILKSEWLSMFPDSPYESERENIQVFRSELLSDNMASINIFMAVVALFLSSTGLFTLISLNLRKRTKEIAVRRIFGASPWQILLMVNRWFIWLVLLAIILGATMGYFLTEMFMKIMFSQYLSVGFISVGFAAATVLLIISLTSGFKAYRVGVDVPVDSLRAE